MAITQLRFRDAPVFTALLSCLPEPFICGLNAVYTDAVFLQLFVKDNQAGEEVTQIDYLCVIGSPISVTNMSEFKRVGHLLDVGIFVHVCESQEFRGACSLMESALLTQRTPPPPTAQPHGVVLQRDEDPGPSQ